MRRPLYVVVPSVMAMLTACAPAATTQTPVSTPAKAAVEQKATVGISNIASTLDQHLEVGLDGRRYDIFDPLLIPDEKSDPQPSIAISWKTIDTVTWQFTLRQDMKWHDGTPLTADDVKFSYDRITDPANKLAALSRLPTLASTRVIDKATVEFKTKEPDPILLRRLMALAIVPKAYIEKVGATEFGLKPIGSGPFKVKDWKPGDTLTLVANDEHPFRKPILRELIIKKVPEASARVAGLQTGDLDYANLIPLDQVERVKAAGIIVNAITAGASYGFTIDPVQNDKPIDAPTANVKVRQAINYAVNKDIISKEVYKGQTQPEAQLAQAPTFGFNPNLKPYAFDPAKAKALLAEAGYPTGFTIKLEVPTTVPEGPIMAQLIQQNLKDVGITVDIVVLSDVAVWREKFYNTQPRAPLYFIPLNNSPAFDADFSLQWFWSKNSAKHYNSQAFDTAYEASKVELDVAKRRTLLQQAMQIMYDDAPFLWIVPGATTYAYNPQKLKGVTPYVDEVHYERLEKIG